MQQYVTDLRAVNPKDIRHINDATDIQLITTVINPRSPYHAIAVLWVGGDLETYSIDGKVATRSTMSFIYRPKKIKVLKPLYKILSEHPKHRFGDTGVLYFSENFPNIKPSHFHKFGKELDTSPLELDLSPLETNYPECWIEEIEIGDVC